MARQRITTRRRFLQQGAGWAVAGMSGGAVAADRSPVAPSADGDERVLVVIQLTGGNDGLNTLIPVQDDVYHRARPTLAIRPREALRLSDSYALHPAMRSVHRLFHDGQVALVRGVGFSRQSRSHFRSMDAWHTGTADGCTYEGWLGRWLDECAAGRRGVPVAVTTMPGTPLALTTASADRVRIEALSTGRRAGLVEQMEQVLRRIASHGSARVYWLSQSGYDTHVDQKHRHARQLGELDDALGRLAVRLRAAGRDRDVLVMVFSEFGRSIEENATGGTDHGEAGVVLLIGGGVEPGFHGASPDLALPRRPGPAVTTDARGLYRAVLVQGFGAGRSDAAPSAAPLDLFRLV